MSECVGRVSNVKKLSVDCESGILPLSYRAPLAPRAISLLLRHTVVQHLFRALSYFLMSNDSFFQMRYV